MPAYLFWIQNETAALMDCTCYDGLWCVWCRDKMRQTYEFALEHIGMDYHSTPLWMDYITFLKLE